MTAWEMLEHSAARTLHDEHGRTITLGLSEAEIRLECVRLVCENIRRFVGHPLIPADQIVETAGKLAGFVLGGALVPSRLGEAPPA